MRPPGGLREASGVTGENPYCEPKNPYCGRSFYPNPTSNFVRGWGLFRRGVDYSRCVVALLAFTFDLACFKAQFYVNANVHAISCHSMS